MEISDGPESVDPRARAREIDRLAEQGGTDAPQRAAGLLTRATDDPVVVAICERIIALDHVRAGRIDEAADHIERAIAAAQRSRDDEVVGAVHLTAMSVAASKGRHDEALRHADTARGVLPDDRLIRLEIQRATVLHAANRSRDAYESFRSVLADHPNLAGLEAAILRMNLGSVAVRLGRLDEGVGHLRTAQRIFDDLGDRQHAAGCAVHAARAAAQAGDFTAVFKIHREIDPDGSGVFTPQTLGDLADCLMAAGLLDEAETRLREALTMLGGTLSELTVRTELSLGRLLLRRGEPDAAELIGKVRDHAAQIGDQTLHAIATIEFAAHDPGGVDGADLAVAVAACRHAGLEREAIDGEIVVMERWLNRSGGTEPPNIAPSPISGSNLRRAQAHHQRALISLCADQPGLARASLARGLRAIDRSRSAIGADELRAAASDRAPAMAHLGLRAALEHRRPGVVLEWAERVRAAGLRLAQPTGTTSAGNDADLEALRALAPGTPEARDAERRILEHRRTSRASEATASVASAADLRAGLAADQVLLEFVVVDGRLFRLDVRSTRTSITALDVDLSVLHETIGKLLFGLRRMASATGPAIDAARTMVETLSERLSTWLTPATMTETAVVVVPTGALHHLPWAALPTLAERAVSVAPSAHVWLRASQTERTNNGVVVATGPGLPEAENEALEVGRIWGVDHRRMATTTDLADFSTSDTVHVCCHGRFRADSPQFSSIELADGPFMVVDLDGAPSMPSLVVLSACNVGAVDVRLGDDLLGFPAAMLARGVRTLIAASLPIEDRAASELAITFHHRLAGGDAPAEALNRARRAVRDRSPAHAAAAAALSCYGAG